MDQEKTSSILFLIFFFLLLPFPLCFLQGKDGSASTEQSFHFPPFSMQNVTLFCDYSIINNSLPLSSGSTIFFTIVVPFQEVKAKFSASFSTEFNGPVFFLSSEKLLLDEQVISVEFGLLKISRDLVQFKNGRNRCLTVWLPHARKLIKKPNLSAKFNLGKQFLPILHVDFSGSKKMGNDTNLAIKTFMSGTFKLKNYEKEDIALGVYTPVLALMSIISAVFAYLKKLFTRRRATPEIPSEETVASTQDSAISNLLDGFHKFTYSELSAATNDFHESELLGRGLYASVYRAVFPGSNTLYAVKRFNLNVSSKTSYEIEAIAIHRLRHDKILELRGWCDENLNEPLLVYDYMPNKSLEEALWNRKNPLLWPQRYKVAVGVAEALVYLHEECMPLVIHGDIKEGNVMLDADFNPKLGDFGLAMSFPPYILRRTKTQQDPPECQLYKEVTEKIDVYLYGSMLLGLCCHGTRRLDIFSKLLRNMKLAGKLLHAVDKRLGGNYNEKEMLRVLNVGLMCLEEEIQKRPSMKQVLKILASEEDTDETDLIPPIQTSA